MFKSCSRNQQEVRPRASHLPNTLNAGRRGRVCLCETDESAADAAEKARKVYRKPKRCLSRLKVWAVGLEAAIR